MKKLFAVALAASSLLMANAEDFTVYNNGALTQGIEAFGWYNCKFEFNTENPTGGDTKVFSFCTPDQGPGGSMGLFNQGAVVKNGSLNSATLNFKWYAEGTGTCRIRLTADGGPEQDFVINITDENNGVWATEAVDVATTFPNVSKAWIDYVGKGAGYVFGVVIENATPDFNIYFDNIYYSNLDESWEAPYVPEAILPTSVPAVEQNADDVLSIFSSLGNHSYNIGGWGQSTQCENVSLDGGEAVKLTAFNYLGWELQPAVNVTDYDFIHVDYFASEETKFGFTIISPGQEKAYIAPTVNVGEWNGYDVPLTFWTNVDLTNVFQLKFDQGEKVIGYLANVYFYKSEGGGDEPDPVLPGNGAVFSAEINETVSQTMDAVEKVYPYTLNYKVTYNEDKTLTIEANYDWTNGEPVGLTPGSVFVNNQINDFPAVPRVVTTKETYDKGMVIPVNFYLPMALGVVQYQFMYTVGSTNEPTSAVEIEAAEEEVPVYYTIQGVRVNNPEKGLYIRVANGKAQKVIL